MAHGIRNRSRAKAARSQAARVTGHRRTGGRRHPGKPSGEAPETEPRILSRSEHPISRQNIPTIALKVLYRLHRTNWMACLVGGSVRDMMLGRTPKDFDVGTDATPRQLRRVFRNSRVIGRRFLLVHVYFRDGIVDVTTFRRDPDPEAQASDEGELLITDDNVFGTPQEDAFRRDFTINALLYNIADYSVIDYTGGVEDLENQLVRAIGDPDVRFQEDPVRMVRACEFAARLGFAIESGTQEAILRQAHHIDKAAPARLTDELLQLLRSEHAGGAFQWMVDLGLLEVFLPEALPALAPEAGPLARVLPALDELVEEGREISDVALFAALLIPAFAVRRARAGGAGPAKRKGGVTSETWFSEAVSDYVLPLGQRLRISRERQDAVAYALAGLHEMQAGEWSSAGRVRFLNRRSGPDAFVLFEIVARALGGGSEELRQWKAAFRHRSSVRKKRPRRNPRKRRPRRR